MNKQTQVNQMFFACYVGMIKYTKFDNVFNWNVYTYTIKYFNTECQHNATL